MMTLKTMAQKNIYINCGIGWVEVQQSTTMSNGQYLSSKVKEEMMF